MVVTSTVAADGTCLPVDDSIAISPAIFQRSDFEEAILAYLNSGGAPDALAVALGSSQSSAQPILLQVASRDITTNGIPDILVTVTIPYAAGDGETHVLFYTCAGGRYTNQILFRRAGAGSRAEGLYAGGGARLLSLRDLNQNGLPDILFAVNWPGYAECFLLEWDGAQFTSLIEEEDLIRGTIHWLEVFGGQVDARDTNGDGTLELVVSVRNADGQTQETGVWVWNGVRYAQSTE